MVVVVAFKMSDYFSDIPLLVKDNTSAIYARKPFPSGKDLIKNFNIALGNTASPPYLPRSTTLSTRSSIGTVTSSLKATTPQSPLERKIISSWPTASPPSKTLHKIPLSIYPVPPPLSPVSGYFFNCMALQNWKIPDTKTKKKFSKPYESGGKPNPLVA